MKKYKILKIDKMTWNNIQGEIGLKIARIQEH